MNISKMFYVLAITTLLLAQAAARLGSRSFDWEVHHKPQKRRSLQELSGKVFEELVNLQDKSIAATLQVPQQTRRLHRILVEGSGDEGQAFDEDARAFALKALRAGTEQLYEAAAYKEHEIRDLMGSVGNDRALLSAKEALGIILFTLVIVLLVTTAVSNIINGVTGNDEWPVLGSDNSFLTGALGESYGPITPCNKLPLASDEKFSYLPITQGLSSSFFGAINALDLEVSVVGFFRNLLDPRSISDEDGKIPDKMDCYDVGEECQLNAECCPLDGSIVRCGENDAKGICESQPLASITGDYAIEPFCLLWSTSEDGGTLIDTIGFATLSGWPPIKPLPILSLLPKCAVPLNTLNLPTGPASCTNCEYILGFPITRFNIGPVPFWLTVQFDGIAFSWANKAKLAYGTNRNTGNENAPEIWDGFRNQPLPEVPDINFWVSFSFNIIPLSNFEALKIKCAAGIVSTTQNVLSEMWTQRSFRPLSGLPAFQLYLKLNFEIYVGFDKQTQLDGEAEGEKLASNLAKDADGEAERDLFSDGQDLWRGLSDTGEDPCVIISLTRAQINVPIVGRFNFGNAIGGNCNFSPEETGVRCTPSGFFFNINQEFDIEGGVLGILASFLASNTGSIVPPESKSGNSIGIFQNPEGENEAVVLRLEMPATTLFGIPTGSGRPVIHFQYVKGSEVERRRKTILRTRRSNGDGTFTTWVPNCAQVGEECKDWSTFDDKYSAPGVQTQICSDILLNPRQHPDKLLYYNRVLTADPVDESLKYLLAPPDDTSFKTPDSYDFEGRPDDNVIIVYLALIEFGNLVISIKEISVTAILSDGPPPPVDDSIASQALAAYNGIADDLKGLFRPPTGWMLSQGLQAYKDYLPESDDDSELEAANAFHDVIDGMSGDALKVYLRLFCKISVLFFLEISIGLIMENYGDRVNPNIWNLSGQFALDLLGIRNSVAVTTQLDFDNRRFRHLEGEEFHRALASSGLKEADYSVSHSMSCVPDSFCEAFVEFFEDIGEAIYEGVKRIGAFFTEDIKNFANRAIEVLGDWGAKLGNAIATFFTEEGFKNAFDVQPVTGERLEAFGADAVAVLSSGFSSVDDLLELGSLVLDGLRILKDIVLTGIIEVAKAIGEFFSNVAEGIANWLGLGKPWDEVRTSPRYTNVNACLSTCRDAMKNPEEKTNIKRNCWCMDELECAVKIPQYRTCRVKSYFLWTETKCSSWQDVPIQRGSGFPRYEGRRFDESCRKERAGNIAQAKRNHEQMVEAQNVISNNFQNNFQGLANFEEGRRRRRRLDGCTTGSSCPTAVDSVSFTPVNAVEKGVFQTVQASGNYQGAKLSPGSTSTLNVNTELQANLDYNSYRLGPGDISGDDGASILRATQRAAASPYLEDLTLDDSTFMAKQPIISPPTINLDNDSVGLATNPVKFDCKSDANLAETWLEKITSAEPETLRRRRSRRLTSAPMQETAVEYLLESRIKTMIHEGEIQISVELGQIMGGSGDDVFAGARDLLGKEGAGAFLNGENYLARRHLQGISVQDLKLRVQVVDIEPFCDRIDWIFEVHGEDSTGKTNSIDIAATLQYGEAVIEDTPPSFIQTRCDSTPYGVEDLEDNKALLYFMKANTLKPRLGLDSCPSPYLYLAPDQDEVINEGTPCTTDYKQIRRNWSLRSHAENNCPVPESDVFPFEQTIELGGFEDPQSGEPATPVFELRSVSYNLPNVRYNASIATNVSDFYSGGQLPASECGICEVEGKGIVYSHPDDFICDEVGGNYIAITVLNNIGVSVTKGAVATVVDDKPPNMGTKSHTVFLNDYGMLDPDNQVTVPDIDDDTWDNCGINTLAVEPTPLYQCADEGPQTVTLTATDINGNINNQVDTVIVDDSTREGIGGDVYLDYPKEKYVDYKMRDDFGFNDCKEIGVYIRPDGDSNFFPLNYSQVPDFEGFNGDDDWHIPKKLYEKNIESVLFYQALCGTSPTNTDALPNLTNCTGEVKAEVLCQSEKGKSSKDSPRKQTCYRAKLNATKSSKGSNNGM